MPLDRNDGIWLSQPVRVPPLSVLRSRPFWRQLYRLDDNWDADAFQETYTFEFWVWSSDEPPAPATNQVHPIRLEVVSRPEASLLYLNARLATCEIARTDETATMPRLFRWRELEAIAAHFEAEDVSPAHPSVALLMLAPFLAGTDDEKTAILARLPVELGLLGLLTENEIDEAVRRRFVASHRSDDPVQVRWIPDPSVGWCLDNHEAAYSERVGGPGQFPGEQLVRFLRGCGVDDL
jgi:hypothetical protein